MSLEQLLSPYPWQRYSKKLVRKIETPRSGGVFTEEDAKARGMRLAVGKEGEKKEGNCIAFYWLVDPEDGVIADARYQAFGQSALIGAAEAACELAVSKNYDQAHRMTADLLDKHFRDHSDTQAFPVETSSHLNLVVDAMEQAVRQCSDISLPDHYAAPPMTADLSEVVEGGYPGWEELSDTGRISVIEQVLDGDVRPYIALDAGGVEVKKMEGPYKLVIGYQGNCTSCISSIGATLSYIQQIIRNKVHPEIIVHPEL